MHTEDLPLPSYFFLLGPRQQIVSSFYQDISTMLEKRLWVRGRHNVCIFGRAGVGKSTVVKEIKKVLTAKGEKMSDCLFEWNFMRRI